MKQNLEIHNVLKSVFPSLENSDIDALLEIAQSIKTKKKEIIIHANTLDHSIIFLVEGMLRGYFINQNGEEKNIFLRPEKTITGAPECLFDNLPTKYTFEAMSNSHLLVFQKGDFEQLAHSHPNLIQLWIKGLQENISTLVGRVESLIDHQPEQRYEELLNRSPSFFQKAYNKHIANYLGITSVSLSRIIKRKSQRKN